MNELALLAAKTRDRQQQRYISERRALEPQTDRSGVLRGKYLGFDANTQKALVQTDAGIVNAEFLTTGSTVIGSTVLVKRNGGFYSITDVPR